MLLFYACFRRKKSIKRRSITSCSNQVWRGWRSSLDTAQRARGLDELHLASPRWCCSRLWLIRIWAHSTAILNNHNEAHPFRGFRGSLWRDAFNFCLATFDLRPTMGFLVWSAGLEMLPKSAKLVRKRG